MINTKHLVKVTVVWTSIIYVICFFGVMMFSGIRPGFMMYGLHMNTNAFAFQNVFTFGTFISGLVIWDIIAVLSFWLFAWLWNTLKK